MPKDLIQILLIEDNPGDTRLIQEMLLGEADAEATYRLVNVPSLKAATERCSLEHFDVILLDMNLPDSTGLSTIQHLNALVPHIAIVVLTGMHDEQVALQSVQYGAQDYITKNQCTGPLLKRLMHYAIERKRVQEEFKRLATHDPLTGLPNRTLLYDRLSQTIHRAQRNRVGQTLKWKAAVMLLDVDNFKQINDNLGHDQGDAALQLAARRLRSCLRESDTVARLGGDEFVLIVESILDQTDCLAVGRKVMRSLAKPVTLCGSQVSLGASIGISIFPDDAQEIESLIKCADIAMYSAKLERGQIRFFKDQSSE